MAATTAKEGHEPSLFLAGDGVLLLDEVALSGLEGKGKGNLRNHFDAICAAGGRFFVSGMSAEVRGMDEANLEGKPAEFAMPDVLVQLAAEADVVLTY